MADNRVTEVGFVIPVCISVAIVAIVVIAVAASHSGAR